MAPDVVWVSAERLPAVLREGKVHAAPDLTVAVLSPSSKNEQRDREAKGDFYSRQGAREYWIVDWQHGQVQVYRRQEAALQLVATLVAPDTLRLPLLPGFAARVGHLFGALREDFERDRLAAYSSAPLPVPRTIAIGQDPAGGRTHGRRERLRVSPYGLAAFEAAYACLTALVPRCPNERHVVHSDLLNRNVFIEDDHLTGVIDWGACSTATSCTISPG